MSVITLIGSGQMASSVENLMALAFPVFRFETLAKVIPTFSESSVTLIFLLASITSRFTIIRKFDTSLS